MVQGSHPNREDEEVGPVMSVNGPGAYAPGKTVVPILERIRDGRMPEPITAEFLVRASLVTESLAPRTIQSLKLLDVMDDDGRLTARARDFSQLNTPDYKPALRDLIKQVYSDVFAAVEPDGATYEQVQDAFRAYMPQGQRARMVSLFLALLEYAEYGGNLPHARATASARNITSSPTPPSHLRRKAKLSSSGSGSGSGATGSSAPPPPPPPPPPEDESMPPAPPADAGEDVVIDLGEAGTVSINVKVRWLSLPDETFMALRKGIRELEALSIPASAPKKPSADVADNKEDSS